MVRPRADAIWATVLQRKVATSPAVNANYLRAFRQSLKKNRFGEGENVAIVCRWPTVKSTNA
jgi:hypothetical protein